MANSKREDEKDDDKDNDDDGDEEEEEEVATAQKWRRADTSARCTALRSSSSS
jgi:hypothetical protein